MTDQTTRAPVGCPCCKLSAEAEATADYARAALAHPQEPSSAAYALRCHIKTLKAAGRNDGLVEDLERAAQALETATSTTERKGESVAWQAEYDTIRNFYGERCAQRSRFLLMRHIDDGLHILSLMGATDAAKAAFCLHPIVQNDEAVDVSWSSAFELACEYRDKANAYLCRPETDWVSSAQDLVGLVGEMTDDCRAMLIADKRQNYADFIIAHFGTHERSSQLDRYFRIWLEFLGAASTQVPKGLTPRHCRIAAFALYRLSCDAHRMAGAAAQKCWRGKPDDHLKFAADAKDADEARSILLAAAKKVPNERTPQ